MLSREKAPRPHREPSPSLMSETSNSTAFRFLPLALELAMTHSENATPTSTPRHELRKGTRVYELRMRNCSPWHACSGLPHNALHSSSNLRSLPDKGFFCFFHLWSFHDYFNSLSVHSAHGKHIPLVPSPCSHQLMLTCRRKPVSTLRHVLVCGDQTCGKPFMVGTYCTCQTCGKPFTVCTYCTCQTCGKPFTVGTYCTCQTCGKPFMVGTYCTCQTCGKPFIVGTYCTCQTCGKPFTVGTYCTCQTCGKPFTVGTYCTCQTCGKPFTVGTYCTCQTCEKPFTVGTYCTCQTCGKPFMVGTYCTCTIKCPFSVSR